MSTPLPYLGVTSAANVDAVRLVLGAMGTGWGGFGVVLIGINDTDIPTATPTGYYQYDASASSDLVATLQAIAGGDVPGLDINGNPILWGQNGIISQADAIAAFASNKVQIISAVGVGSELLERWRDENVGVLGYKKRTDAD